MRVFFKISHLSVTNNTNFVESQGFNFLVNSLSLQHFQHSRVLQKTWADVYNNPIIYL